MPKRSKKHGKKSRKGGKSRKQNVYVMKGCSKNTRKNNKKVFSSLGNSSCANCGPNCMCGPNCNCPHKCPGNCYLNKPLKKGGAGCGPGGCPIPPFSWEQMNAVQGGAKRRRQAGGLKYPPPDNVMKTGVILPFGKVALGSIGQIGSGLQTGGSCGSTCGLQPPVQSGGGFYKPGSPMPGPFIGKAWGPSVSKWPGVDGIGGNRNYLKDYDSPKNNIVANDPALQQLTAEIDAGYKTLSSYVGGYKYKNNREKRGGGIIPQDLVNLGQDFTYNLKSAYNALNGYKAPVNPLPYKDQLNQSLNFNRLLL
jgi:hypothetical protein